MATDDVQTNLRIPGDLKDRLMASAEAGGRSLSGEVAYRVARAYELEAQCEALTAQVAVGRDQIERLHMDVERWRAECQQARHELAAVHAKWDALKLSQQSEIAAATKSLGERLDAARERAAADEKALATQASLTRLMAQFVISAGQIAGKLPGVPGEVIDMMTAAAQTVKAGDSPLGTVAMERLFVTMMAIAELPKGRDLQEFTQSVLRNFEKSREAAIQEGPPAQSAIATSNVIRRKRTKAP